MQHMPALCLNLVGATPALPLDLLSAIPVFLFDPRECLNCDILMTTHSALDVSALDAKPGHPSLFFFFSVRHSDDADDADDLCTAL